MIVVDSGSIRPAVSSTSTGIFASGHSSASSRREAASVTR